MANFEQWAGFKGRKWTHSVDVRDFIQENYTPYEGDEAFLEGPTEATDKLWGRLQELQKEERAKGGVLDMETEVVSGLTAYGPGYIDESMKDLEQVVGLQTDKPLKRAFMPYGGIKMAEQACTTYGYQPSEKLHEIFTKYHKTHNHVVDDLLSFLLCKCSILKISVNIDIKECRDTSYGHSCTILCLDCCKISEVQPLSCFVSILSRLRNIESVCCSHLFHLFQSFNLICKFFTKTEILTLHAVSCVTLEVILFSLDQEIDTYGRGRIVGDYRRVALYGIDALIEGKQKDFAACDRQGMRRYDFQLREEIADQIRALKGMKVKIGRAHV